MGFFDSIVRGVNNFTGQALMSVLKECRNRDYKTLEYFAINSDTPTTRAVNFFAIYYYDKTSPNNLLELYRKNKRELEMGIKNLLKQSYFVEKIGVPRIEDFKKRILDRANDGYYGY